MAKNKAKPFGSNSKKHKGNSHKRGAASVSGSVRIVGAGPAPAPTGGNSGKKTVNGGHG